MFNLTSHRLTQQYRISLAFVAAAVLTGALTAVFWSRFEDSPGLILAYLTAGFLIMAFVHQWQKPGRFLILAVVSIVAFFVFVLLHNLAYAAAELTADYPFISGFFSVIDGLSFLLAVVVAPAAAGIGLVCAVITWWRQREKI
jgi:DMSO/TMAO reductase YedYZ heme-binding membrane subunit